MYKIIRYYFAIWQCDINYKLSKICFIKLISDNLYLSDIYEQLKNQKCTYIWNIYLSIQISSILLYKIIKTYLSV